MNRSGLEKPGLKTPSLVSWQLGGSERDREKTCRSEQGFFPPSKVVREAQATNRKNMCFMESMEWPKLSSKEKQTRNFTMDRQMVSTKRSFCLHPPTVLLEFDASGCEVHYCTMSWQKLWM